jgi:membrane protease YdiL (CAAX protease family)
MKQPYHSNKTLRTWERVPVVLKAILSGFLVSSAGIAIWVADMAFIPLPWSILPMMVALGLYCYYFSGRGAWQESGEGRAVHFRLVTLRPSIWKWGLLGALLFVLIVQSGFVITFRLIEVPDVFTSEYKMIETMPKWIAWSTIVMSSLVAGVCEETGYRGYMQVQLEKRYGPAVAITLVSIVFVLIHLGKAWSGPILPLIFFASVLLGILAYSTGSLIPGIIGHTILDVFDYSFWWTNLMGKSERPTVLESGVDYHFLVWCLFFLTATSGFFWLMKKLRVDVVSRVAHE